VSPETVPFISTLLVGVDGTPDSERALAWGAGLATSAGAEVLAVHVLTYDRELGRDMTFDTMTTWRRELRHDLETGWVTTLTKRGVRHRCELIEAESASAGLLMVAEREGVDLIVVGSPGHGGLGHRLFGSTISRLTYHGHCPVAVVPPGPPDPPAP
jgi:nucleotide-binding universal stress UspA family protein